MGDAADPDRFNGRPDVLRLLESKLQPGDGRRIMVETAASGGPAFALYYRGSDGLFHAHSIQTLLLTKAGVSAVLAFHTPEIFPAFGLPVSRTGKGSRGAPLTAATCCRRHR